MIITIITITIASIFLIGFIPLFIATQIINKCTWPMNIIIGKKFKIALLKNWNSKDWILTEVCSITAKKIHVDLWEIYAKANHHSGRYTNNHFLFAPKKNKIYGDFIGEKLLKGGEPPAES